MTKEEIISELKITEPIVCIYPYGSHNSRHFIKERDKQMERLRS